MRDVDDGVPFVDPAPRMIEENMWRAIRFGLDGRLISLEQGAEYPAREAIERQKVIEAEAQEVVVVGED